MLNTIRSAEGVEGQVNRVDYDVSNDAMSQYYNSNFVTNSNNNKKSELVLPPIMSPLRGQVRDTSNNRG